MEEKVNIKSLQVLYRLDLDNFTWRLLSDSRSGPNVSSHKMNYYQGSLHVYSVDFLYIYNLDTNLWARTIS